MQCSLAKDKNKEHFYNSREQFLFLQPFLNKDFRLYVAAHITLATFTSISEVDI